MIGWTRLEVNGIMQFLGVRNRNFNSMFRRSFVWKAKARFVHKKFLSNYLDHEKDGIFEEFLTTSQASVAGLRIQRAFERDHSKDDCYQLIENYCNGGDGFLTEDTMRKACSSPLRQRQIQETEGLANVLEADQESNEDREEKDAEWKNLRNSLVDHMLANHLALMSFHEFKKTPFKQDKHPNLSKADMWGKMAEHEVVRPALVKGKTSKEKPGAFTPLLTFKKNFADMYPQQDPRKPRMDFEEEHDLGLLKKYAFQLKGRRMNAENLRAYYQSLMPAAKKGKRRMTGKRSQDDNDVEDQDEHKDCLSSRSSRTVHYRYSDKQTYSIAARRYAVNGGAQSMSRRLQVHVVDGHTVDPDTCNCCLTLVQQILKKLEPKPALPDDLAGLLDDIVNRRAEFVSQLDLHIVADKEAGNCVPCALWHVVPPSRATIVAAIGNTGLRENIDANAAKHRSYRSVAQICAVDLVACVGLPEPHVKSFMVHYAGTGSPHCAAVRLDTSSKTATVIDGCSVYRLSISLLEEICAPAVDASTVICYWKRDPKGKLDGKFAALLDMVAGAAPDDSEDLGDDGRCGLPCKFSFNEHDDPIMSDGIRTVLCQETKDVLQDPQKKSSRIDGWRLCPLCPFRSFAQLRQLRTHLEKHHVDSNQYVCSGTKHIKVILALYDQAASSQLAACEFLQKSAALLRDTIRPALSHSINHIDKHIRLVLDAAGPRYVNLLALGNELEVRRARNIHYTHSFADLLLREAVLNHAQVRAIATCITWLPWRAATTFLRCCRGMFCTGFLFWRMCPRPLPFRAKIEVMAKSMELTDEWHYVSMDATIKVCLKVLGQESYRAETAWRRLLTVRGRTGAVLLLHPLQNESSEQLVDVLEGSFTADQIALMVHVATDSPSEKLYTHLKTICPRLACLMLDPVHLAIVYEYGFWNKRVQKQSRPEQVRQR
eukprot:s2860_g6.t1